MLKHGYASRFGGFSSFFCCLSFLNLKLLTKNIQLTNSISLVFGFKLNDPKLPVNTTNFNGYNSGFHRTPKTWKQLIFLK